MDTDITRCNWSKINPLYALYHDEEWGVPVYDDLKLFEILNLGSMQAGLNWLIILKKRVAIRQAFANFEPEVLATFTENDVMQLMQNEGIIRNRAKIMSVINNAKVYLELQKEQSFSSFLWSFVNNEPIQNQWQTLEEIPTESSISQAMSKAMKAKGFSFVGPTICYASMQAMGMINDHVMGCFRHEVIRSLGISKASILHAEVERTSAEAALHSASTSRAETAHMIDFAIPAIGDNSNAIFRKSVRLRKPPERYGFTLPNDAATVASVLQKDLPNKRFK